MIDVSSTLTTGTMEEVRFMGSNAHESVLAPQGIIRHDVTLLEQRTNLERRLAVLKEYHVLIEAARASFSRPSGTSPKTHQHDHDEDEPPAPLHPLVRTPTPSPARDSPSTTTAAPLQGGGDPPTDLAATSAAHQEEEEAIDLVATLLRSTILAEHRAIPCYCCGKDILHVEYASHVQSCKVLTEQLLRKAFLNPARFATYHPTIPVPSMNAPETDIDEYAGLCSQSLGKSMVDCTMCKRLYNIHELDKHKKKCTGRNFSEVMKGFKAGTGVPMNQKAAK